MNHIILPGLTTTPRSDWRRKTEEINELGLEEISLFPTFLKPEERKEFYEKLGKTCLKRAPHVHLRDDMEQWELDYFREKYKTEVFNVHPDEKSMNFLKKIEKRDNIFVENQFDELDNLKKVIDEYEGICLDTSHAEDVFRDKRNEDGKKLWKIMKMRKIGCCHISAVREKSFSEKHYLTEEKILIHSDHWMNDLSELDYVKKYVKYLPKYVSIELENDFEEQLKAKEYLEKIIRDAEINSA